MIRRLPPALRRRTTGFLSHLLAGIAAGPLLLVSVAADEVHEFIEKLEVVALALPGAAIPETTGALTRPAPRNETPAPKIALTPEIPAEFADLMLQYAPEEPAAPVQLAALSLPDATLDLPPLTVNRLAPLALPEPDFIAGLPGDLVAAARIDPPRPAPRVTIAALTESEIQIIKAALSEYRKGALKAGDDIAARASTETARLALEWAAIRTAKQLAGFSRINRFAFDNPDMPMAGWVEARAADALFVQKVPAEKVLAYFVDKTPETSAAKIALGRALAAQGKAAEAQALVRTAYRDDKTNASIRTAIAQDFPGLITAADQRYLAERLIYEGQTSEGLAVAA